MACSQRFLFLIAIGTLTQPMSGGIIDWELYGAVPDSRDAAKANTRYLNIALARLRPGDTLYVSNKTFWLSGGVKAIGLISVTLKVDGTLQFLPGRKGWPLRHVGCASIPLQPVKAHVCVEEAFFVGNSSKITFTSSGSATLDGNGDSWWGYIRYALYGENRPRLLSIFNSTDILVERWNFVNSAYWTFTAFDVARLEIRQCTIDNRVNHYDGHDPINLAALNTDGFDVAGRDIYIHNCSVWNQDDCFTIQPMDSFGINSKCTENVLVENVNASGLGLTVGAVVPTRAHNCVRNVTFRHAWMHHTFKGIYVKSQNTKDSHASAEITNLLYDDIVMESPSQVPIWIGPAQEADSYKACSLLWPKVPLAPCPPPPVSVRWANITLRNIQIREPRQSPGIIYGNSNQPMKNVLFDNGVVTKPGMRPWGLDFYKCDGVHGFSTPGTNPMPPCFNRSSGDTLPLDMLSESSLQLV